MEKCIIDRETWLHRDARKVLGDSYLLDQGTGLMCCLGQLGRQRGVNTAAMENVGVPSTLDDFDRERFPERLFVHDRLGDRPRVSQICQRIMGCNDGYDPTEVTETYGYHDLTLEQAEAELTKLFAELGIQLEFVGNPDIAVQRALDWKRKNSDTTV